MTRYIDKAVIKAELERIEHETNYEPFTDEVLGKRFVCRSLLSFLDTLEVKEVDLEEEVKRWKNEHGVYGMDDLDFIFAKHFFELGLKTKDQ